MSKVFIVKNKEGIYTVKDMTGQLAEVILDDDKINNLMAIVTQGMTIYKVVFRKRRDMEALEEEDYLFARSIEEAKRRFRLNCRKYTLLKIRKLWT